ncbi:MAG TPA: hypothetical protein VLK24_02100 [Gaiellaceae bacterium]|nr:hypothetical protein [Gaiellaceae bacterium]
MGGRFVFLLALATGLAVAAPSAATREATCYSDCLITYLPHQALRPFDDATLGASVTWSNQDTKSHVVAERHGVFRSPALGFTHTYSRIMSAGSWSYYDPTHPKSYLTEGVFAVRPVLRRTLRAVIGSWGGPFDTTGKRFCVYWSVTRTQDLVTHYLPVRYTTRYSGKLVTGHRLVDDQGHAFVLFGTDKVSVKARSGNGTTCPKSVIAHRHGWSDPAVALQPI